MTTNDILTHVMAHPVLAAVIASVLLALTAGWWRLRAFNLQAEITAVFETVPVATVGMRRARALLKRIAARLTQLAAALARLRPLEGWDEAIQEAGPGLVPWRALGYVAALLAWPLQILLFAHAMALTWAVIGGTLFDAAWTRLADAVCSAIAVGDGSRPRRALRVARTAAGVWGTVAIAFVVAFFAARGLDVDVITESVAAYAWLILAAAAETAPIAAGAAFAVARIMGMPSRRERDITNLRQQMQELERAREVVQAYISKIERPGADTLDDSGTNPSHPGPASPPAAPAPAPNGGVHAPAALVLFLALAASVTEAAPAVRCAFAPDVSVSVAPVDRQHVTKHLDAAAMVEALGCAGSLAVSTIGGHGAFGSVAYIPIPTFRDSVVCPRPDHDKSDVLRLIFPRNFGAGLGRAQEEACAEIQRRADADAAERRRRFNANVQDILERLVRDAHDTSHTCLVEAIEHLAQHHQILVLLGDAMSTCMPLPQQLDLPAPTRLIFLLTRQTADRPERASRLATGRIRSWRRAWPAVTFRLATDTPPDVWESIAGELARNKGPGDRHVAHEDP